MPGLENSDDKNDETYIPSELESESDYDEVSGESYSCQSISWVKDSKNDNDEIEVLRDWETAKMETNLLTH